MRVQGNQAIRSLALLFALLFFSSAVKAQSATDEAGPLIVEEASGAAKIKMANRWLSPAAGMMVTLPATVSTGSNGSIQLRQDETVISVAANTAIELIAGAEPGAPLQRAVQDRGSAFYDIAPRVRSRLRVETPWLVAVIKGTEFNVTVAAETSTVALFEGRLQIEAPGSSDVVDLHQGQIAKRHKDDAGITVVGMDDTEAVPERGAAPDAHGPGDTAAGGTLVRDDDGSGDPDIDAVASLGNTLLDVPLEAAIDVESLRVDAVLEGGAGAGELGADLDIDAKLDLAAGPMDLALDAGADLGDAVVDVGLDAGVDLAGGDIDLGFTGDIGVGDATAELDVDLGADLDGGAIDLGLDTGIDAGDTTVDIGTDVAVDLDRGELDLGLTGAIDIGGDVLVDSGIDAGIDTGNGGTSLGAGLDAGLDLGDTSLDAGLEAGVDIGGDLATEVDGGAEVTVAGVDVGLDVGVDLDLGNLQDLEVDLGLDLDLPGENEEENEEDKDVILPLDPGDLLDLLRF
jgi:FecR protein